MRLSTNQHRRDEVKNKNVNIVRALFLLVQISKNIQPKHAEFFQVREYFNDTSREYINTNKLLHGQGEHSKKFKVPFRMQKINTVSWSRAWAVPVTDYTGWFSCEPLNILWVWRKIYFLFFNNVLKLKRLKFIPLVIFHHLVPIFQQNLLMVRFIRLVTTRGRNFILFNCFINLLLSEPLL